MPFMPFNILGIWLRGLLALAIPILGILLLTWWYDDSHVVEQGGVRTAIVPAGAAAEGTSGGTAPVVVMPAPDLAPAEPVVAVPSPDAPRVASGKTDVVAPVHRVFRFDPGWNRATAYLGAAIVLLVWALAGRWIGYGLMALGLRLASGAASSSSSTSASASSSSSASDDPRVLRTGEVHRIRRPDGSELQVESYGPKDAPTLVLTHGWGATSDEWYYEKTRLADRFRLIVWDEPGLGLSKKPDNNDYRMEKLAADLAAVLSLAGDRPVVLLGHSIGGMILLTFCRLFPENLIRRVAGLALVHTTYKNPVRTTQMAALYTALEKPVLTPLLHLTIAFWPLVWLMNWLSYFNGSLQKSTRKQSFAAHGTPGQIDFLSRMMAKARPDVLARGMFGMMAFDETATLPTISVPTLVVIGDRDITTLPEAGRFIARNIPGADLTTLAPARHLGLMEYHDRFDQLLADFATSSLTATTAAVVTT
jgi:pimeloyl-ACP methyl ester carboxylesterase